MNDCYLIQENTLTSLADLCREGINDSLMINNIVDSLNKLSLPTEEQIKLDNAMLLIQASRDYDAKNGSLPHWASGSDGVFFGKRYKLYDGFSWSLTSGALGDSYLITNFVSKYTLSIGFNLTLEDSRGLVKQATHYFSFAPGQTKTVTIPRIYTEDRNYSVVDSSISYIRFYLA